MKTYTIKPLKWEYQRSRCKLEYAACANPYGWVYITRALHIGSKWSPWKFDYSSLYYTEREVQTCTSLKDGKQKAQRWLVNQMGRRLEEVKGKD